MAFSAGTYSLPGPALNTGDTVSATENNTLRNDMAAAFNKTWLRDGTAAATANIPLGGFKLTGLAAGSTNGDSVRYEQLPSSTNLVPVASGGTGATTAAAALVNLGALPSTATTGFKNRIINGAMVIDQRNAGGAVSSVGAAGVYLVDRWGVYANNAALLSAQRNQGSVTPPAGFTNYLGLTSLGTNPQSGSTEVVLRQPIEAFNTFDLNWGTANAASVTLSFWVRSSLTGTFSGNIRNFGSWNRSYVFTYTINSANTWEYKTITIAGDTTGTWNGASNSGSLDVGFDLGAGSGFRTSTVGAWTAGSFNGSTGANSIVATNGATFYITGVQLEKGSTATSFDYRPYGTELALCQRYCPVFDASTGTGARILGYGRSTTSTDVSFSFPVTLRTPPNGVTVFSASNFSIFNPANGGSGAVTSLTFSLGDIQGSILSATTTVATPTIAGGNLLQMYANSTNAKIIFNGCEL